MERASFLSFVCFINFAGKSFEGMKDSTQIITCRNCGAKNRVSLAANKQAICGKCKEALTVPASPVIITDQNFAAEVGDSSLPVLVDFWAAWCGPCRMIAPIVENMAKELAGKAKIGKLDVDRNPVTAGRFRVQSIPTLIIFKDGQEVDRIVGAGTKEWMLRRLQPFL
jgi:thioredoxin 2